MSFSAVHSNSNVLEVWVFRFSNALRRLERIMQQQHRAQASAVAIKHLAEVDVGHAKRGVYLVLARNSHNAHVLLLRLQLRQHLLHQVEVPCGAVQGTRGHVLCHIGSRVPTGAPVTRHCMLPISTEERLRLASGRKKFIEV